jgi:RNA-directed DNA polymerase
MRRELHVRFWEGGGVQFPSATRLVILCRTAEEAMQALALVHEWTKTASLRLHPEKTRLVDLQQSGRVEFLGDRFTRRGRWPRKKSLQRLKDAVRRKTRRTNGRSLAVIIADVNRTLVGWFAYFKHSHGLFTKHDQWVRQRLRSILRGRSGRRGRARMRDYQRWPLDFFTAQGLFSLAHAHAAARQSVVR